jgi:hypothetical protein
MFVKHSFHRGVGLVGHDLPRRQSIDGHNPNLPRDPGPRVASPSDTILMDELRLSNHLRSFYSREKAVSRSPHRSFGPGGSFRHGHDSFHHSRSRNSGFRSSRGAHYGKGRQLLREEERKEREKEREKELERKKEEEAEAAFLASIEALKGEPEPDPEAKKLARRTGQKLSSRGVAVRTRAKEDKVRAYLQAQAKKEKEKETGEKPSGSVSPYSPHNPDIPNKIDNDSTSALPPCQHARNQTRRTN